MKTNKPLILIPTYNEAENLPRLVAEIRALELRVDILIVDDGSPDGTGRIADELASQDPGLSVLHRASKQGIGGAHLAGMLQARAEGRSVLVTMDCDFTHAPSDIPALIGALGAPGESDEVEIAVGSRYLRSGSLQTWNWMRKSLTRIGHFLTGALLGVPYDASGAFRAYRLDCIPAGVFDRVQSHGYSFFFESLSILCFNGLRVREIPINLPARTYGHSKMRMSDAWHSLRALFGMWRRQRFAPHTMLPAADMEIEEKLDASTAAYVSDGDLTPEHVQRDWDDYWNEKNDSGQRAGALYDVIASFYRVFIIKRWLNARIRRTFAPGADILHAGCGAGQVDVDVTRYARVTALDISRPALEAYRKLNPCVARIVHGDIFALPCADGALDGIYNLGVMEHFTEDEIARMLGEFRRAVRPGGALLLCWPPEFGLTVNVLKAAHFILNRILKKGVKLHPDEITRIRSRAHAQRMIEGAGFTMERFDFGPADAFTQCAITARLPEGRLAA